MIIANENIDTLRILSQLFLASHFSKIIRNDDKDLSWGFYFLTLSDKNNFFDSFKFFKG